MNIMKLSTSGIVFKKRINNAFGSADSSGKILVAKHF